MESSKFYGNLIEKRTTKFTLHDKCHGNLIEMKERKQLWLSATAYHSYQCSALPITLGNLHVLKCVVHALDFLI